MFCVCVGRAGLPSVAITLFVHCWNARSMLWQHYPRYQHVSLYHFDWSTPLRLSGHSQHGQVIGRGRGLTTARNFIIIYFSNETLARQQGISLPGGGSSSARQLPTGTILVFAQIVSSAGQKEDLERQVLLKNRVGQRLK